MYATPVAKSVNRTGAPSRIDADEIGLHAPAAGPSPPGSGFLQLSAGGCRRDCRWRRGCGRQQVVVQDAVGAVQP